MGSITIHIGMHKTGSSSIQHALSGFDDGISACPDLGYENQSIPFYSAYSGYCQDYHIWRSSGLSGEAIENKRIECINRISESLSLCLSRNLIYSGEDICLISEEGISEIKNKFYMHADRVKIICYYRDPISYAESAWQEVIRQGVNRKSPPEPNYRFKIDKFIRLFGRNNVILRPFRADELFKNDVVYDFFNLCEISSIKAVPLKNKSLSTEAIKCIYLLNKVIDPFHVDLYSNKARNDFIRLVEYLLPGKFNIPTSMLTESVNLKDCRWMEAVADTSFPKICYECLDKTDEIQADKYFSNLLQETIDCLEGYLNISSNNGSPLKLITRLYLECYSHIKNDFSFSVEKYLELNPDVRLAGVNPYEHYLRFGFKEGRLCK